MKSLLLLCAAVSMMFPGIAQAADAHWIEPGFVTEMAKFPEMEKARGVQGIGETLAFRAGRQPFLLVASISSLTEWPLFVGSTILTSFNDNAATRQYAKRQETWFRREKWLEPYLPGITRR